MRVIVPALAAMFALPSFVASQIEIVEAKPVKAAKAQDATANMFYKAFYLDQGARQFDQAIGLYQKFLAASPKSKLAPSAARRLVNLLYRTEKVEAAQAAEKKFANLLANAPQRGGDRGRRGGRGGQFGRRRGNQGGAGDAASAERFKSMLARIDAQLKEAKAAGNSDAVERLERQKKRIQDRIASAGSGGGQGRGGMRRGGQGRGGQGRQGRRRMMRPLTEMTKEEATQMIERLEGFMDRILERMPEERAAEMEKGFKKLKELVKAGKMEEAEKVRAKIFNFRRR